MNQEEKQLDLINNNKSNFLLKQKEMFDRVVEEKFQKILQLNKKTNLDVLTYFYGNIESV